MSQSTHRVDPFWYDDIFVLFKPDRLVEFIPVKDMSLNEKLNSLVRFLIYTSLLLTCIYKNPNFFYILVIGATLTLMVHQQLITSTHQSGGGVNTLTAPSAHNPFMNVLMTDHIENPSRGAAEDVSDPKTRSNIDKHFNTGLYRDVDDIWDKKNSQRQYYTNPSTTIPNDADSFMKWLYKTPPTCKEGNLSRCLNYEIPGITGQQRILNTSS